MACAEGIGKSRVKAAEDQDSHDQGRGGKKQGRPDIGPWECVVHEEAAPGLDERGHRIDLQQWVPAFRDFAQRVQNRGEVEEQCEQDLHGVLQVSEEHVEGRDAQDDAHEQDELQRRERRNADDRRCVGIAAVDAEQGDSRGHGDG